jgi:ribosome biogenesis GTPase A
LDSRFIDYSRNDYVENIIKEHNKELFFVINKIDLLELTKDEISSFKLKIKKKLNTKNVFLVSAKKKYGVTILKRSLLKFSNHNKIYV